MSCQAKKFFKDYWFFLVYFLLYFLAINILVLNRFWQFEAYYYDHGIYDSALWQAAHFQIPLIDHLETSYIRQWGDHFTPTLYLLTPIYWFTNAYEPILIIQNAVVTLSSFILFLIAKKHINSKLMVFAIIFAFTFFIGLQNLLISNLHSDSIAILTLALVFWSIENKKWRLFWLFLILTFGAKQNFASIGVSIGVYLLLQRNLRGLTTIIFSLAYYFLAIGFIIPVIGQRNYWYPISTHPPLGYMSELFLPVIKTKTIIVSLLTFGGLPLFNLPFIPIIFQDFFTRFVLNSGSARWDLGMHYNATLSIILAYGAVLGVNKLSQNKIYQKLINFHAFLIILIVFFLHRFYLHGPIGLISNRAFYEQADKTVFLKEFIDQIPKNKKIMTQNNLASYLTHSNQISLLRLDYKGQNPDIIAIDTRNGQSANNYWPLTPLNFEKLIEKLNKDSDYQKMEVTKYQLIFSRKANTLK